MTQSPDNIQKTPDAPAVYQPIYSGSAGKLFGIYIVNLFLKIITLFIYTFWAKTKMRRYLWSQVKLLNETFSYLGTGIELFKSYLKFSFLIVLPAFIVVTIIQLVLGSMGHKLLGMAITRILLGVGIFILIYYAKYSGLRYRLGRTSWRGIRFELRGSPWVYLRIRFKNLVLNLLTLGLYKPRGDMAVLKYAVNNIYFGNIPFVYRGQLDELKKSYFKYWLLIIPTLGISLVWYRAKYLAHLAKFTRFDNVEFRVPVTGGELFWFYLANFFLLLFTVGLAFPYVIHRRMKFAAKRIKLRGALDYEKIAQAQKSSGGEGAELYFGGDDFGL